LKPEKPFISDVGQIRKFVHVLKWRVKVRICESSI